MEINADAMRPTTNTLADEIAVLLRAVPATLEPVAGERRPLLAALAWRAPDTARHLLVAAARVHLDADERWVVEYLLRHRGEMLPGPPSADSLVGAARCAAEMERRRSARYEVSKGHDVVRSWAADYTLQRPDDASAGEAVVACLERLTGRTLSRATADVVRDAVVIFMELAERHSLHSGTSPSPIAMRPAARPDS